MSSNYGGIYWDNDNDIYEISGGSIKVKDTIYFKNTSRSFNGLYNSLSNRPVLGTGYKYNNNTTLSSVASGEIRFNNTTLGSATQFSINLTDTNSNNNETFIETFDESTNTNNKGIVYLHEEDDYKNSLVFTIKNMESATNNQTYRIFNISRINVRGNGLTNSSNYIITFSGVGDIGSNGAIGAQGATGVTGAPGQAGGRGIEGPRGNSGAQGATGNQGATGAQGTTGNQGATGAQGTTGNQGTTGANGFDANSCTWNYNQNGSIGSGDFNYNNEITIFSISNTDAKGNNMNQWLLNIKIGDYLIIRKVNNANDFGIQKITTIELEPPKNTFQFGITLIAHNGNPLVTGDQLFVGYAPIGSTGAQGATGSTGATGNQGGTGATGAQGATGSTGATGSQGTTGNQGETGAQGATGSAGARGIEGAQGATGNQGGTGATGAQGAAGAKGNQGNTGATGSQGATGSAGARGIEGAQGATGNQGGTGATGAQGATGNQGNTGATGAQGAAGGFTTNSNAQIQSLGVGTAASTKAGSIRATSNITAYYSSDINLKENLVKITNSLDKVNCISGYNFDWKDKFIEEQGGEDGFFVKKHDIGLIAQEVEEILPEVVCKRPDGYKGVRYELVIPLLVESIKELKSKIEKLESKNN